MLKSARSFLVCAVALCAVGATPTRADGDDPLDKRLKNPKVPGTFVEALKFVGRQSGLAVKVDWDKLGTIGVTEKTPVKVSTPYATVRVILDMVLASASPRHSPLGWAEEDETLYVTTQQRARILRAGGQLTATPAVRRTGTQPADGRRRPARPARRAARSYNFDNLPLADVLDFFRTTTGVNFHVNWESLRNVGITKQTGVLVNVSNVSAARALDLVMDSINGNRDKFQRVYWVINRGVVTVATGEALNKKVTTRVFDVADLLFVVRNFESRHLQTDLIDNDEDDDEDDRDGIFGDDDEDDNDDEDDEDDDIEQRKAELRDSLIAAFKSQLDDDMWQPVGKGSVRIFRNQLIVRQTLLGWKLLGFN